MYLIWIIALFNLLCSTTGTSSRLSSLSRSSANCCDFAAILLFASHLSAIARCEHDFCGKAVSTSVQGIHYTEKTLPNKALQLRDRLTVSTAFHSLQQVQADYGSLDYAFLSPIFNSISKAGYQAAFDLDELAESVQTSHIPLIALGGQYMKRCTLCHSHACCTSTHASNSKNHCHRHSSKAQFLETNIVSKSERYLPVLQASPARIFQKSSSLALLEQLFWVQCGLLRILLPHVQPCLKAADKHEFGMTVS